MDETYEAKKYGADKIVLWGLLIAAVLIAHLVTAPRSAIALSEPIRLNYTGLPVLIPTGNGRQSKKQWEFEKNASALSSFCSPSSGGTTALSYWRYVPALK